METLRIELRSPACKARVIAVILYPLGPVHFPYRPAVSSFITVMKLHPDNTSFVLRILSNQLAG